MDLFLYNSSVPRIRTTEAPDTDKDDKNFFILIVCFLGIVHVSLIAIVVYLFCCKKVYVLTANNEVENSEVRASVSRSASVGRRNSPATTGTTTGVQDETTSSEQGHITGWHTNFISRVVGHIRSNQRSSSDQSSGSPNPRPGTSQESLPRTPPPPFDDLQGDGQVFVIAARDYEGAQPPSYDDIINQQASYGIPDYDDLTGDKPPAYEDIA